MSNKLYIKQKVFSIGEKYNIYDEFNNKIYHVEAAIFSWGSKIKLYETSSNKLLFHIKQKVKLSIRRQYKIYDSSENLLATVKQKTVFSPKLEIKLNENEIYIAKGDFLSFNFQILNDGIQIGSVCKKILAWGDTYELNISHDFEPSFFAAIVITIDDCLHNGKN